MIRVSTNLNKSACDYRDAPTEVPMQQSKKYEGACRLAPLLLLRSGSVPVFEKDFGSIEINIPGRRL